MSSLDLLFIIWLMVFQVSFMLSSKVFILSEKKSLSSSWFILVTLFLICLYAANNKSDWFFTAAFFIFVSYFRELT